MSIAVPELPPQIVLRVGQTATVLLPSYAGGGYDWSVTAVIGSGVADVSLGAGGSPPSPPALGTGVEPPPDTSVQPEWLRATGRTIGEAVWRLELARPFGAGAVAAEHSLRVTVVDDDPGG
jgi:hypothetical protein